MRISHCHLTAMGMAVLSGFATLVVLQPQLAMAQGASAPEDMLRQEARELGIRMGSAVNSTALNADNTFATIPPARSSAHHLLRK